MPALGRGVDFGAVLRSVSTGPQELTLKGWGSSRVMWAVVWGWGKPPKVKPVLVVHNEKDVYMPPIIKWPLRTKGRRLVVAVQLGIV